MNLPSFTSYPLLRTLSVPVGQGGTPAAPIPGTYEASDEFVPEFPYNLRSRDSHRSEHATPYAQGPPPDPMLDPLQQTDRRAPPPNSRSDPAHFTRSAARKQADTGTGFGSMPDALRTHHPHHAPDQAFRRGAGAGAGPGMNPFAQPFAPFMGSMPPPPVPVQGAPRAASAPRPQPTVTERTPQSSPARSLLHPPDQYEVYLSAKKPRQIPEGGTLALFDNSVSTSSSGAAAQ